MELGAVQRGGDAGYLIDPLFLLELGQVDHQAEKQVTNSTKLSLEARERGRRITLRPAAAPRQTVAHAAVS